MKVWINGKLVEKQHAKISVFDHAVLYGEGVFEGIRVYGGKAFRCAAHVDRLFASARSIRLAVPLTKQEITDAIDKTVAANGTVEGYVRLAVTRGAGTLGLDPYECSDPTVFIIAGSIALYPPEMYEKGMAVIIAKTRRMSADMLPPSTKSLNYLNNILAKIEAIDAGVAEAIMLNAAGDVAEGTGDNVFIVRDAVVITPPPAAGILIGITRGVVMELAAELGIPLKQQRISVEQLYAADECFLTGTAAEVIAVTKVDDHSVGSGKPGPITNRLLEAFRKLVSGAD